jgi:uncharacterized protein
MQPAIGVRQAVEHRLVPVGPRAGMLAVGAADVSTLPSDHQAVYDRLTGPRRLLPVDGATHNDLYDNQQYVQQVIDEAAVFLQGHTT